MFSENLIFGKHIVVLSVTFYRLFEHFPVTSNMYDICVLLPLSHPLQIGL